MDFLKQVQELFHFSSDTKNHIEDRMNNVVMQFSVLASDLPGFDGLKQMVDGFPDRDKVEIFLEGESENSFSIESGSTKSAGDYISFTTQLETDEEVAVTLQVTKSIEQNVFSVYCFEKFCQDLNSLPISKVLEGFSQLLTGIDHLYFQVFDTEVFFKTGTMAFSSGDQTICWELPGRDARLGRCREVSGFIHQNIYSVIPEDFHIQVDYSGNPVTFLFGKVCTALSLAYLATTSSIVAEELRVQITGQRNVDHAVLLCNVAENKELYKIYRWIFTDGNAIDKALLARNSISAHCKYTPISKLDGKTLSSIQSNYNLYLKDNVAKYIELTNAMANFIKESTSGVGDCISQLLNHLKTNLLAMLSFVFTVALANAVSDQPLDHIFTCEITWIMYLVLAGSLVYFIISIAEVLYAKSKLCEQYEDLIEHYKRVLSEDDINHITDNGKMLAKAKKSLKNGMWLWSIVWIVILVAAFVLIDCIGDGPHLLQTLVSSINDWFVSFWKTAP